METAKKIAPDSSTSRPEGWLTVRTQKAFENAYLRVDLETVQSPGREGEVTWTVVHRKAAAVIAPRTVDGRYLLVRQERVPLRAAIWEFPAGQIDETGEHSEATIRETAEREMREECGYRLAPEGELIAMGRFFSSPGFTDEHSYLFLADGVEPDPGGHDHDEHEAILECRAFTADELLTLVASGVIEDANTLSTIARLLARELFSCSR